MKRHNQLLLPPMKGVLSVVDLWFNFFQMKVSCGKVHRAKIFEKCDFGFLEIFYVLLRAKSDIPLPSVSFFFSLGTFYI